MSINATQSHSGEHLVAKRICNPEINLERNGICKLPQRVWGGALAASNFAAFWTEMEASGAMILSIVMDLINGM